MKAIPKCYPSSLTPAQGTFIAPYLPAAKAGGKPCVDMAQAGASGQCQRPIIDSQSVKIGTLTNQAVGFDGGKQVKGRKRHLLVDTLSLMLMVNELLSF
jgi:hypothetical protein